MAVVYGSQAFAQDTLVLVVHAVGDFVKGPCCGNGKHNTHPKSTFIDSLLYTIVKMIANNRL